MSCMVCEREVDNDRSNKKHMKTKENKHCERISGRILTRERSLFDKNILKLWSKLRLSGRILFALYIMHHIKLYIKSAN